MTVRWRFAWAGFELGSPDYQEKVLSTTLVRDHLFIVIWVELYVAVRNKTKINRCMSRIRSTERYPTANFAPWCFTFTTATFYPQDIILLLHVDPVSKLLWTYCPSLWCFNTTTYDPLTYYSSTRCFTVNFLPVIFYYCNILTLWSLHTATFHPCDVFYFCDISSPWCLLLQHFFPVTFYSCNIFIPIWYVRVTNTHSASRVSCHCVGTSTFFYLDRDKQATYAIKKKCGRFVTRQVTPGDVWAWLAGVEQMSQWPKDKS